MLILGYGSGWGSREVDGGVQVREVVINYVYSLMITNYVYSLVVIGYVYALVDYDDDA